MKLPLLWYVHKSILYECTTYVRTSDQKVDFGIYPISILNWCSNCVPFHFFFAWWTNSGIWDKILRRGPFILFYAEKNLVPCKHVLVRVINQKLFLVVYYFIHYWRKTVYIHQISLLLQATLFSFCFVKEKGI